MHFLKTNNEEVLTLLIEQELAPLVRKIDVEGHYPKSYLQKLGSSGLFQSKGLTEKEILYNHFTTAYETSKTCMTTGFVLWCHLAAITYLQNSRNDYLKDEILPLLETGELLGATGLSNPMKFYAGLEKLHLKASEVDGGYVISGHLPYISNLCNKHWFGLIASVNETKRIMAFIPCDADKIELKEKKDFLGLNGSATLTCKFNQFFIPKKWIISENADAFVEKIRPTFVFYQIPLGLGISKSAIQSIDKVRNKQEKCNQFLQVQSKELREKWQTLQKEVKQIIQNGNLQRQFLKVTNIRLQVAYLTLEAIQANMLHHGGAAYLQNSEPFRLLKEGYFFANLTPTVKHLEKLLCNFLS